MFLISILRKEKKIDGDLLVIEYYCSMCYLCVYNKRLIRPLLLFTFLYINWIRGERVCFMCVIGKTDLRDTGVD